MTRLRKFLSRLLFCWLLLGVITASAAEKTYQITETELTQLEYNLNKLEQLNKQSQADLLTLKERLAKSQEKSITLQGQLTDLKQANETQESLLQTANKSLQKYVEEETRTRRRIKRQRNIAWTIAGCLVVYAAAK
ncbi:MAG: hypothetical protein LUG91_09140 [Ruminococcus sp.]|nr:hypothetical protein [Ruminococcus sp.]